MDEGAKHLESNEPPLTTDGNVIPVAAGDDRRMQPGALLGSHTHETANGIEVHIWNRDGTYLVRGRYNRKAFGETLGSDIKTAVVRLRQIIVAIENGTYFRPSERRLMPIKDGTPPPLTLRQLAARFTADKRRLKGKNTAHDYVARLAPAIEFSELETSRHQWPIALKIDLKFASELSAFLFGRNVARNGCAGAEHRRVSSRQVHNQLSCLSTALNWGKRLDVNLLPISFFNPFIADVIGERPRRDPLQKTSLPMDLRIAIIQHMDLWQLCTLALPFVLPPRPEDFAGLLISEVDFEHREFTFATRLGGDDFNKGQVSYKIPWPKELSPLLKHVIGARAAGPLLVRRAVFDGHRMPRPSVASDGEIVSLFQAKLAVAQDVSAKQDRKIVFRQILRQLGGVSEDEVRLSFKVLLEKVRPGVSIRLYDLRHATSTDMKDAGVDTLIRMYVTGHSISWQILSNYEYQDVHRHMAKYFDYIKPILTAIAQRAQVLGLSL